MLALKAQLDSRILFTNYKLQITNLEMHVAGKLKYFKKLLNNMIIK